MGWLDNIIQWFSPADSRAVPAGIMQPNGMYFLDNGVPNMQVPRLLPPDYAVVGNQDIPAWDYIPAAIPPGAVDVYTPSPQVDTMAKAMNDELIWLDNLRNITLP